MTLRDRVHDHQGLLLLGHPRYEDMREELLRSYRKVMLARRPDHRLVSTFRDKLEHRTGQERVDFHAYLSWKIKEKFGHVSAQLTFQDFVSYIVQQGEQEEVLLDPHWRSLYQMCNPCVIKYDFIGKFECLVEDISYAFKMMKEDDDEEIDDDFPFSSRAPATTQSLAHTYLSQLTPHQRLDILSKYLLDYLIFDYSLL
ncbi:hypothetical protein Pmani_014646 [Petrolisthes manimaculis]|uniref:Carbohydrate sulfotransferase n=1 Tax=Petrolisthes manimaculis TaxID=1843537 RepID=A0AAE1PSJ4_9EUCA|nr:hypothetical protein Pmani_014646 [Petrolisthes manimaculis]